MQKTRRPGAIPAFFLFPSSVIPGREANPESRDSGSGPSDHPGMTVSHSSLRRLLSPERRVVRVALGAAAVEGVLVPVVQRRALLQALDQVGVRNERLAER